MFLPSLPPGGTAPYKLAPLPGVWDRLLNAWAHWDGLWYLQIATAGYRPDNGTTAFLPLYPWLVGGLGWLLGGRVLWAGILLSSLCFLGALFLLYDLVRRDYPLIRPGDTALALPGRTVFYLAIFPLAFFFWAVYSESLFLLLAVGVFWAARRGHWWLAAACLGAALWTRPFGVVLVLPLLWEMALAARVPRPVPEELVALDPPPDATPTAADAPSTPQSRRDPGITAPAAGSDGRPPRRIHARDWAAWGVPAAAVAALLGWAAWALGDPLAFITTQAEWNRSFRWPWETVVYAWEEAARTPYAFQVESQSWTYFGALVLFGALALAGWRVLRGPHSLYLTLGVLFPLFSGTPHNPLLSFPRFLLVLFPAFIVLAVAGRWRPVHYFIAITSALLLALYLIRFANWYWVA
jgi:hypothetical protein